jgi:hypothetical protein
MKRQDYINKHRYGSRQWKLLGFLLFTLLTGCNMDNPEENKPSINPENGKIVEVNGEKFRITYIGGVRFRFPDTNQFGTRSEGVSIHLYWPDIPPSMAPETKPFRWLDGNNYKTNSVEVQVRETREPIEIDTPKTVEDKWRLNSSKYNIYDDLKLGLKIFYPKAHPNLPAYAYSLTNDAIEPWGGQPIVVSGEFITFMYAPQVSVRIIMMGWTGDINPDWKGVYLGVIETLNKYREQ